MKVYLRRADRLLVTLSAHFVLLTGSLVLIFPLLWTLSTSLKVYERVTFRTIELIPNPLAWWNYLQLFRLYPIAPWALNTSKVVVAALFGSVVTCSLAGYSFARVRFPGRDALFIIVLSTMMLPYVTRLVPLYAMFDRVGLVNTFWPLVLPRLLGHDAFYVFLFRQFFRGLPEDLFDAAWIDGCSEIGIWSRIVLPLSKPVMATVAIFAFQTAWNDFLNPLIYVGAMKENWTLSLGLNAMRTFEGPVRWEMMMAFSVLMILPVLIGFAIGQRNIVQGVTMSGIRA